MAARSDTEDTADREVRISRVIHAPRERVFDAFTDPDQVARWFGPRGFQTTTHEMTVRVGGLWRFTMRGPDGTDHPNWVRYVEVERPERLVWDQGDEVGGEPWFRSTTTFEEVPEGTRVTLHTVFPTAEDRDRIVEEAGAIEGGKQTLARLAALVEEAKA